MCGDWDRAADVVQEALIRVYLAWPRLDPDRDVTRQGLGVSESAEALKDGKVHAFFWSGGLPTAAVQDLSHTSGITIRMLPTAHLLPALQKEHGNLYFQLDVPAITSGHHLQQAADGVRDAAVAPDDAAHVVLVDAQGQDRLVALLLLLDPDGVRLVDERAGDSLLPAPGERRHG